MSAKKLPSILRAATFLRTGRIGKFTACAVCAPGGGWGRNSFPAPLHPEGKKKPVVGRGK